MAKDFSVIPGIYRCLHYEKPNIEVTAREVNDALEAERRSAAQLVNIGKTAEKGDYALIDYAGFCDGVQFEGGTSSEPYALQLGSNSFIPGFEEQLVGTKAGDEVEVKVTFPEVYHSADLAGKDAIFKCKVHAVQQMEIPALGDEFAKKYGLQTMAQLREAVKNSIRDQKEQEAQNRIMNQLLAKVISESTISLSDEFLERNRQQMLEYFTNQFAQQGLTMELYAQFTGMTVDQLKAEIFANAEKNAQSVAVLSTIAEMEKLEVSDSELDAQISQMAAAYGRTAEEIKAAISEAELAEIRRGICTSKAMDFIMSSAVAEGDNTPHIELLR